MNAPITAQRSRPDEATVAAITAELHKRFGNRAVTSLAVREQHGHTTTWIPNQPPDVVVYPETTEEVADIVRLCSAYEVPVVPFGTGTSLEGHVNAPYGGVCVDTTGMKRIVAVHEEDLDCVVEPGVTRKQLNEHLRDMGLFFPIDPGADASIGPVRKAKEAGIPVIVLNSGEDTWRDVGALTYVGQTEFDAGVAAGERMAKAGVQSALCINHEQGNAALDDRCSGFTEGLGGDVEQIAVTTDPTAARSGIKTALRQNEGVDGLLTLNPGVADQGLRALEESGGSEEITFATFDLSPSVLEAVRDGNMLFATDQQQFLQGYLPVVLLTDYIQYGVSPVNTAIPTGPAFITEDNAEQVINLSEEGIR